MPLGLLPFSFPSIFHSFPFFLSRSLILILSWSLCLLILNVNINTGISFALAGSNDKSNSSSSNNRSPFSNSFTNIHIRRSIFATSPIARQEIAITAMRNKDTNVPYIVVIPKGWNVSYLKAILVADGRELAHQITNKDCPSGHECYSIDNLPTRDKTVDFVIAITASNLLKVINSNIKDQFDPLILRIQVNQFIETIYETEREITIFSIDKEFPLISLDCPLPFDRNPQTRPDLPNLVQFTCGPYEKQKGNQESNGQEKEMEQKENFISISFNLKHYPFLKIDNLQKEITLLPIFDKIKIMERYDLTHIGFKFSKFSRFDLMKAMMQRKEGTQIITSFPIIIHKEAYNIELRDDLGILHTGWNRKSFDKFDILEVVPRFPLIGGWSATLILYYETSIESCLKSNKKEIEKGWKRIFFNNNQKIKSMTFPFVTFGTDVNISKYHLIINLPENAQDISWRYPYLRQIQTIRQSRYKTFFSITGEQRIEFISKNLVKEYEAFITITFKLSWWWSIFKKPIIVILFLFTTFQGSKWIMKKRFNLAPIYTLSSTPNTLIIQKTKSQ